jgi:hypothetical protein
VPGAPKHKRTNVGTKRRWAKRGDDDGDDEKRALKEADTNPIPARVGRAHSRWPSAQFCGTDPAQGHQSRASALPIHTCYTPHLLRQFSNLQKPSCTAGSEERRLCDFEYAKHTPGILRQLSKKPSCEQQQLESGDQGNPPASNCPTELLRGRLKECLANQELMAPLDPAGYQRWPLLIRISKSSTAVPSSLRSEFLASSSLRCRPTNRTTSLYFAESKADFPSTFPKYNRWKENVGSSRIAREQTLHSAWRCHCRAASILSGLEAYDQGQSCHEPVEPQSESFSAGLDWGPYSPSCFVSRCDSRCYFQEIQQAPLKMQKEKAAVLFWNRKVRNPESFQPSPDSTHEIAINTCSALNIATFWAFRIKIPGFRG